MKHWITILAAVFLLTVLSSCSQTAKAQDQQDNAPPKAAGMAYPPIGAENDQEEQPIPAMQPDDRPLTGFQQLTTGTPPETHSYWIPGLSYTNFIQSNALGQGGGNGWNSTSYIVGNLSLSESWRSSQLALNYSGGESLSSDSAIGNGQFHRFGGTQTFNWRRWQVTLLDQFSYLPQSQFGFGAGMGIANPGVGGTLAPNLPGLQAGFNPNQTIFAAVGPQYTNTAGSQVNYQLTPRSSITLGGIFGILRFSEPGNIESNDVILNAGYNYELNRTDTVGLSYDFTAYHYLGLRQAIGVHTAEALYGKKITGRLALRLAGGPEITSLKMPQGTNTQTQYISGTGSAGLSYAFSAGGLSLSYNYGVNSGSGLLVGATSNQITGSATRKLTRVWSGNASLGYARIGNVNGTAGAQNPTYGSFYIAAGLQRQLSRDTNFTVNYTANIQTSNNAVCAGPNCAANFTTHMIIVSLSWRARPFVLP